MQAYHSKMSENQGERENLKNRGKESITFKGEWMVLTVSFSIAKVKIRRKCNDIINAKNYHSQPGILNPVKINFRDKKK